MQLVKEKKKLLLSEFLQTVIPNAHLEEFKKYCEAHSADIKNAFSVADPPTQSQRKTPACESILLQSPNMNQEKISSLLSSHFKKLQL